MLSTPEAALRGADPPIACRLNALDAEQRERQKRLLGIVRGKIRKTVELPDGFALEMRLDNTVWVTMTGQSGAKEVLAAEMGIGLAR